MENIAGIPPAVLHSGRHAGLTWKTADSVGFPGSLLPADNNNFAPRLGVAYRLTDKTVSCAGLSACTTGRCRCRRFCRVRARTRR